ncbi:MAG: porin family protein [Prevotella sp.]|nr:porin family protein [Prevotella sp.]
MKKFFMTLAAACMAATMNAQVYVGGGIGLQSTSYDGNSDTYIKFMPEIGYNLNENWALGIALGYSENNTTFTLGGVDEKKKSKKFQVSPYVRYTFVKFEKVNLFVDGGLDYTHTDSAGDKINEFALGLRPGVTVSLNDKLSFVAHAGFLGWRTSKADQEGAKAYNTFCFDFDGSDLSFGLYYNF